MEQHDHQKDNLFMRRALELAANGRGHVSPNPLVGSIVVCNDRIIGEGWHRRYGEAHAEVNAIQSVVDKSLLNKSTVYVNLEPCSHHGKTPPCADMLLGLPVKRVVVSNLDSNPLVAGNGIKKLRSAGVAVTTGVLEAEGRELNKRFFTFMEKQRPYIILKWAQTSDAFIARENHNSKWISNPYARQLVHKWRTEEDAILVGATTAAHDNPQLNVRDWTGRNPVRIVIDRFLRLNEKLHLFDGSQKTIRYNLLRHEESEKISLVRIDENDFLDNLVRDLRRQGIQSVLVEGGSYTLTAFIQAGLWDEARILTSPMTFGKGVGAPAIHGRIFHQEFIETDLLTVYKPL